MDDKKIINLLIVDISVADTVVECPIGGADVGDLVEFTYGDRDVIGTVTQKILSRKDSEEYKFMSTVTTIYEAKNTWHRSWSAENAEDQ